MDLTKYKKLEGSFVCLKSIEENDASTIYEWRTSKSGQHLNQPANYSVESQINWIRTRPVTEVNYIIYTAGAIQNKVGMISIVDIDEKNKKAEVGRLLLDATLLAESNPYGLEALKITYDLVLNQWHFNKIYGSILSSNVNMIKLQKFLGMKEEGILKDHLKADQSYLDLHLFAIFPNELNKYFIPRINFLLKSFSQNTQPA